ncbi:NAD(P)-dependent oxidoreductase [Hyphococcus flavus]|uniref:NAD(P)-dependent oxidoreductase n=1 Tax=Hyphococcus flavus TaxID=1866326 RepID=A0AAE9ZCZ6_9PROT|nr:NAD(P)-dependent oxidoreductase [Hyphococcus flavus]WDI30697.1 NAD(P)-dependent oxidoreductase [Hyphococcus flavus]
MQSVAFLGLGVMGYPMAGHLSAKGYEVVVYNRTLEKAERWAGEHKGVAANSPAEAVRNADIIFACLGDDPDVEAVVEKAAEGLKKGAVFVDHTTASPSLARRLHKELSETGVGFVDAPVSGGQAGAENGKLSVMCGGDTADVEAARAAMESFAARIVHIGPSGHGQLCKAVNQICIAGVLQGLSEGVHFAARSGLDVDQVLKAISGGAAQSWQMENRAKTMAADEFDFGFAVDWMRKDLRIALTEARDNGARLPLTALVDQFYADVQAMGGGRWDTSSLIRRLTGVD